jgi:dipeptidyl aminopeptidase/acylaminoacyl peptidase
MPKLGFAVALWLVIPVVLVAQRQPFTANDAATLRRAQAVAVSPDGKTILYKVVFGGSKGPDQTEWKLIASSGGAAQNLSIPDKFKPSGFTGDSKALYGTYEVNKMPQLATFPLVPSGTPAAAAATPVPLTSLPRGIHSAAISPDGKRYAIVADPRLPDPLADVHMVIEAEPASLYVISADGSDGAWWCPTLKEIGTIAWSPDGTSLGVQSQTPKIGFHDVRSSIDTCGTAGARHLATIENSTSGIGWINNGKDLVTLSTSSPVLTPDHVWTVSASGGTPQDRTPTLGGSATQLSVDAKGNAWVAVMRGVQAEIDSFKGDALVPTYKWPDGTIDEPLVAPEVASAPAVRAFTVTDPRHTSNVAIADGNTLRKITSEGDEQLAKIALGDRQIVHWSSPEGVALEGIVTFPADYSPGRQYPFMVLPHGGPESNDVFSLSPFTRIFSGMGYVVLQPEYRGSTGYGTDFMSAIYQHFGDRAYRDVDSATDFAIAQGWADPKRLTIFGWSAGGS